MGTAPISPDNPPPGERISITDIVTANDPDALVRTFDGRTDRYAETVRAALRLRRQAEAGNGLDQPKGSPNLPELVRHAYAEATHIVLAIAGPADMRHLARWERRTHRPAHAFRIGRFKDDPIHNPKEPGIVWTCPALQPGYVLMHSIRETWSLIGEACTNPGIEHVWVVAGRDAICNIVRRLAHHRFSDEAIGDLADRYLAGPGDLMTVRNGQILEGYEP